MDVRFFGRLSDRAGPKLSVDVPEGGCSVAQLRRRLAEEHPVLSAEILRPRVRACVDGSLVLEDHTLRPDQTVEFLPPVSGG